MFQFGPVFVGYERTEEHKKKAEKALSVLETILSRQGTKFAAGGKTRAQLEPLTVVTTPKFFNGNIKRIKYHG